MIDANPLECSLQHHWRGVFVSRHILLVGTLSEGVLSLPLLFSYT
jgi:hypothetical protein